MTCKHRKASKYFTGHTQKLQHLRSGNLLKICAMAPTDLDSFCEKSLIVFSYAGIASIFHL